MTTDIWCLPDEVLEYIFSYMPVNEKLKIAVVCKHWLKVLDSPLLLEDVLVEWTESFIPTIPFKYSRQFPNFMLSFVDLDRNYLNFFIQYGDNIKGLVLYRCIVSCEIQKEFYRLELCKHLSSLRILDQFINVFSYLPSLKFLRIDCLIDNEANSFERIGIMPNLEELSLKAGDWCFTDIIPHFLENRLKVNLNKCLFQRNVKSQPMALSLEISDMPEQRISDLIEMRDYFQLKQVHLNSNDSQMISNLLKAHNKIIYLYIDHHGVNDDNVKLICSLLPALKTLTLECTTLESSLIDIFRLKSLQQLTLSACTCGAYTIKSENFTSAFRVAEQYNLTVLELTDFSFDNEELGKFLKKLPHLEWLQLTNCKGVSDETVKIISKYLTGLEILILEECREITDAGIYSSCYPEECISNIKGLTVLNLSLCKNITSKGLLQAIKFQELFSLSVTGDRAIDAILRKQNPCLKYLSFSQQWL